MDTIKLTPPKGFVLDTPPPAGFVLDGPAPPTGFVLDTAPEGLSLEPTAEDLEIYRKMGVEEYRSPSGKMYDLGEPQERVSERVLPTGPSYGQPPAAPGRQIPLSVRMQGQALRALETGLDAAHGLGARVQYLNLKLLQGLTFNAPEIITAVINRVKPDLLGGENFEEATLKAAQYDPSGFMKVVGEVTEFIGRLKSGHAIGKQLGLLGGTPKSIGTFGKALEAAKLGLIAGTGEQISLLALENIDPDTDYGYEGAIGPVKDAAILAAFSVGTDLLIAPALAKVAMTKTGQTIIKSMDDFTRSFQRNFPRFSDMALKKPPEEITKEVAKYAQGRGAPPFEKMTAKQQAFVRHVAREWTKKARRMLKAYRKDPTPDIVRRAVRPKAPLQLTGAPQAPTVRPVAPPVAARPAEGELIPPRPTEAITAPAPVARAVEGKVVPTPARPTEVEVKPKREFYSELSTTEHLPSGSYILINTRQDTKGRTQVRYKPEDGTRTEWIDTDQYPHEIIAQALARTFGSTEELPKNLPSAISIFIAVKEGKPVPREVLEEYKGEKWADEALAKVAKPEAKLPEGYKIQEVAGQYDIYRPDGERAGTRRTEEAAIKYAQTYEKEFQMSPKPVVEGKVEEQNFTVFAREHGYTDDYSVLEHGDLSPSGRRSKRSHTASMRRMEERIESNKAGHEAYRKAILEGKIIDPDGVVTKEGLLATQKEGESKKIEGRLNQIRVQIQMLKAVGKGKRGTIKPSYQKRIDELEAERKQLTEPPAKGVAGKAVEGKQPWEMTLSEYKDYMDKQLKGKAVTSVWTREGYDYNNEVRHKTAVVNRIKEGKPVSAKVLRSYKGEKWADEALAKVAKPVVEGKVIEPVEPSLLKKAVTVSDKKFHPVRLPTEAIGIDAERFQFKLGARLTGGVTEALKEVEKFDPIKGGIILVWQDKTGKHWVIDGHHRVALARKTGQPEMEAWVVREADGWSAEEARAVGALRNLADGKGTAIDAAKLFRDSDISLAELRKEGVPTNNTIVQQGMDIKKLSDEVFRLVIDDRLPANMAATIGKHVLGDAQQKQVADLILEGEVDTVRQAELLAMTIDSAPILTKSEQTLFGLETTEKSLYAERAKVLANVEKKLKTNKKVFGTLAKQSGLIEAKGNILARVANLQAKELAEEVLYLLEKFANAKGEVAEALNEATKEYAKDPTRDNLSKITNELVQKWTEATTGLSVQNIKGLFGAPAKRAEPKIEGKPGFIDVRPLAKVHKSIMNILEPSKAVEIAYGKEPYAAVIKGIHRADVGRIEFNEGEIENLDRSLQEFGEQLDKYSKDTLTNLMAARGKPVGKGAIQLKNEALKALAKESPELIGLRKMITRIADFNYKYLQKVVGDDIHYVEDYFYGIYKDAKRVERFLDYWKTTKRFTKEKKLPTVADALAYGLELRDPNPINNLRSEYMAIAHLDGMVYMRDELLRTGKGKYINTKEDAPIEWEKVKDPVFKDHRVAPELAQLINKLISTNKIQRMPVVNALRKINNFLRTLKFMGSAFHQLSIAKQSIADEGYLQFLQPSATRGVTLGFRKNDPIFKTQAYRDYIQHGGGHRYSIASEAQRAFTQLVNKFNKSGRIALKAGVLPLRIPEKYVRWLFQSYIPKVKFAKYSDRVVEREKELGRQLTSPEKIDIIKEQQNFYGMMNERLFGRGGTATTALRLWFMAPGYAEGNYRTILKSILQWGGPTGYKASRSRSNIINSLLLSAIAATAGTMIMTGKPPKKPETLEDVRDLFKIDTGMKDEKGRRIMIDLLTYDKDYWNVFGNIFTGRPDKAVETSIRRTGGMVASTAETVVDLATLAQGRAIYDWKGDRVTEITDPFATKVLKIVAHEIKRIEPISVSVYGQSRKRNQTRVLAALTSLLGYRPTLTEKDRREQQVLHRIYSLKGQQEELYQYLATIRNPRKAVERYNRTVDSILSSPMIPQSMRKEWEPKLVIDLDRYLENRAYYLSQQNRTEREIKRAKKILENFGITPDQAQEYLKRYWQRERKRAVTSPLERDRVIGRTRKRRRLEERMQK